MARPGISFIRALVQYGRVGGESLANIETWQAAAIADIAQNKGGHIVSGSGNGVSFTQQASMTNLEWFETLSTVLNHIENGTTPTNRTVARLV